MLDRHKQALLPRIDRYVDFSDPVGTALARGRRAPRDVRRPRPAALSHAPDLPARAVGRSVAAARARRGARRAEPRLVVRADRARGDAARRRARGRLELLLAAESEAILGPEVAARFGCPSSRSASTTSTRSREGTSRSSATRPSSTRARRSASRTRSTRPTTSCRRPPARRSSSACARTPTWTPSSATRARRSRAGRSTRLATSSCTTPSSTGST